MLGSCSLVIGGIAGGAAAGDGVVKGYENLPEWVREGEEPDRSLRANSDEMVGATTAATIRNPGRNVVPAVDRLGGVSATSAGSATAKSGASGKEKEQKLEDWLAEDEGSSEEGSEGEYEEEEGDESGDEESEEEEEGEEESDRLVRP